MQEIVIEAGRTAKNYWKDLWRFKELLLILALRDVTVRYKQTSIGILWAIIRPVMMMMVFVFAYDKVAKIKDDSNIKYQVIIFSGILLWNFFATALQQVSNSITGNSNLVSKVYFPRLIMAISSISVALVDFMVGLLVLIPMLWYYGYYPDWNMLMIPFFLALTAMAAFSLGLIFAVLNVKYRDFQQIVPLVVQYGFFVCPVVYSVSKFQDEWWFKYYSILNPLSGIIEGFRWSTIQNYTYFQWSSFIPSLVFVIITTFISIVFFRKKENSFVDFI